MWVRLRAVWRLALVLACLIQGLVIQLTLFPRWTPHQKQAAVIRWSRRMLWAMNVQVQRSGHVKAGPLMVVSNHFSWLDILVTHSQFFGRFVAKGEVRAWPVMGHLAAQAGTFFIERSSRRDALRMVQDMTQSLGRKEVLIVFPEGTTNDGASLLPFHANLIQAAIEAQAPIQAMGLSYWSMTHPGERSFAPRFFGSDTLLRSVWTTLCTSGVVAKVHLGEEEQVQGRDRRQWAHDLRQEVKKLCGP